VLGQGIVRLMVIAPFFVMPTVKRPLWKNLLMHPVSGLFAWISKSVGLTPIDWFADAPLTAIILMVATVTGAPKMRQPRYRRSRRWAECRPFPAASFCSFGSSD